MGRALAAANSASLPDVAIGATLWLMLLLGALLLGALCVVVAQRVRNWAKERQLRRLLAGRSVAAALDESRYGYDRLFPEDEGAYWIFDKTREGFTALVLRVDSELEAQLWILRQARHP